MDLTALDLNNLQNQIILGYMGFINLAAFIAFGIDKSRATRGAERIRERKLFLLSLIGGVFGGILGMLMFHHKTRKGGFKAVMFVILVLDLIGYYYVAMNYLVIAII